ncbi:hypothetical protein Patl1_33406 [Pistacia atlantica]|uniref:Uncharacterized protein n=1 Tax=Pistacia atlantica TaxID=434234 RepID=A0ACC0ZTW1_9ROSI|nr:hypothetical protein Patl1_33406 [Pistacia atlantica]
MLNHHTNLEGQQEEVIMILKEKVIMRIFHQKRWVLAPERWGISLGNIDVLLVIFGYLRTLERGCLNMPSTRMAVNILTKANVLIAPAMAADAERLCSLLLRGI